MGISKHYQQHVLSEYQDSEDPVISCIWITLSHFFVLKESPEITKLINGETTI